VSPYTIQQELNGLHKDRKLENSFHGGVETPNCKNRKPRHHSSSASAIFQVLAQILISASMDGDCTLGW
jgi:DeoR/GlpR family transcriptional regulator of sugar metabolism